MNIKTGIMITGCLFLIAGCSNINKTPFVSQDGGQKINEGGQNALLSNEKKLSSSNPLHLNATDFDQIKVVDGKNIIQNPSNILVLVNKTYSLPDNYIPNDLVRPNVAFSFGSQDVEQAYLRKEAAGALEEMFANAKKSGIILYAVSGYRSYSRQQGLFDNEVNQVGEEQAAQAVAVPGTSEHQTGLAMDIASQSTSMLLTENFAETKEGQWLEKNAHLFGFILRYPKGKEGITNYEYEPWHYRYVGVKAATIIYQHNWTLEEYLNQAKKL